MLVPGGSAHQSLSYVFYAIVLAGSSPGWSRSYAASRAGHGSFRRRSPRLAAKSPPASPSRPSLAAGAAELAGGASGRTAAEALNGSRLASASAFCTAATAAGGRSVSTSVVSGSGPARVCRSAQRHVADEQGQRGAVGWHRVAQFRDRLVLDAGVDEAWRTARRRRPLAAPTTRPTGPPSRVPSSRPQTPAPRAPRPGVMSVVSVTLRVAVGVAGDQHGVVQLEILLLLQPGRGQQELLRPQPVVEGDDDAACCRPV